VQADHLTPDVHLNRRENIGLLYLSSTPFNYFVFGLSLRSNLPIPGLISSESSLDCPQVRVHLGVSPQHAASDAQIGPEELTYTSPYLSQSGEPLLRVWRIWNGAYLRLSYLNGMQFWLGQDGNDIWTNGPEDCSIEDIATYLLGPVLGVLLRLRGTVCLHASAIAMEDRSVALVGPSGAGKSTTAAILAQRGWSVVSDDVVALAEERGMFCILPAYPYLCLLPDSVTMLYGSNEHLPRFVPQWEKRRLAVGELGMENIKFEQRALPLAAIYLLEQRTLNSDPNVDLVSQRAAFIALVANSYATGILNREMRAEEFAFLGRLVESVAIRSLAVPQDANGFPGLHNQICADIQRAMKTVR
jgi:hypothetical protein